MRLSALPAREVSARMRREGLAFRIGGASVRLKSSLSTVVSAVTAMYADYPLIDDDTFIDFPISIERPFGWRRWIYPQVKFFLDGRSPFKPLPLSQAFPMLEWGLNWCVANHFHHYLILHAAMLEKGGQAVIMPGQPGSGKSTLCAALVCSGWRLLSDEMTVISIADGKLVPFPRPVSLKNESIEVIRNFSREAEIGPVYVDTRKGAIAHMKPPPASVVLGGKAVSPAWIVSPRYLAGAQGNMVATPKSRIFMHLAENAFNYHILGQEAFKLLGDIVDRCDCYRYVYSDLDQAVASFDALVRQ
jgi:HprK-related kinase A